MLEEPHGINNALIFAVPCGGARVINTVMINVARS